MNFRRCAPRFQLLRAPSSGWCSPPGWMNWTKHRRSPIDRLDNLAAFGGVHAGGPQDGRGISSDDSAPDGVDGRLDAVVDLELHQDVRDVVLHRLRADVELSRDLRVVLAVRDQLQDLDLAVGELGADRPLDLRLRARRAHTPQDLRGD